MWLGWAQGLVPAASLVGTGSAGPAVWGRHFVFNSIFSSFGLYTLRIRRHNDHMKVADGLPSAVVRPIAGTTEFMFKNGPEKE
jgi:hypothetical protein